MPTKKIIALICTLIFFISLSVAPVYPENNIDVSSDKLDKITKELADMNDALNKSVAATKPLQSELDLMQKQIQGIKNQVASIEYDMQIKKQEIDHGYKNLAKKQELVLHTIRDFYIKSYAQSPLSIFLSDVQNSEKTQREIYQEIKTKQDRNIITNIALSITNLENKKNQLAIEQKWLISTKSNLDEQSTKLDEVIKGALAYQKDVSAKIEELSAQQQAIINARSGGFTVSIGDSELADDYYASIKGFREAAPSGYFAIFSFGAHSHRKGMSQYGARGRAENGQNYKQILSKYYGKEPVNKDTGGSIKVAGYGEIDFEGKYLLGIAEMPSTWHPEALKAQAIAARTYAYRYKQQGLEICTDENCQVFNNGKANNPPEAWKQAVESTRGEVLEDVVAYYSSTSGGYLKTSGWDTTDGSGGKNFIENAYEKIGGSPWLYKAWYTEKYNINSNKCGRSSPWLSPEEMADIVNAAIALRTPGIDTSRITPTTTNCWDGNPYSIDELRNVVANHGGISSANNVSVSQGDGITNNVVINGTSMTGPEFRKAFNLRAPGFLSIPQSDSNYGPPFFNIEYK